MQKLEPIVRASKYVGREVREEKIEMPTPAPRNQKDDKRLIQERIKVYETNFILFCRSST